MKWITCSFCKGTGKDPFDLLSEYSTFQVCTGTGKVHIEGSIAKRAFTKGTGVYPHTRITCNAREDKGSVTHNKSRTMSWMQWQRPQSKRKPSL